MNRQLLLIGLFGSVLVGALAVRFWHYNRSQVQLAEDTPILITATISHEPKLNKSSYRLVAGGYTVFGKAGQPLEFGDYVQIEGKAGKPGNIRSATITLLERPGFGVAKWLASIRAQATTLVTDVLPPKPSMLVVGMVLGVKLNADKDFMNAMRTTGTIHILVVSGANLTLVAGFLLGLERIVDKRRALLIALAGIWFYAALTGLTPPVLRAAIMTSMAYVATLVGRQYWDYYGLVLAASGMLLLDPALLTDLSFQLSFMATLGIMSYAKPIAYLLRGLHRLPFSLLDNLSTTLAAQLLVNPLILVEFHQLAVLAPIVNVLVLPLVLYITIGGMVLIVIAAIAPPIASLTSLILLLPTTYFVAVIEFFAGLQWASVALYGVTPWMAAAFYLGLLGIYLIWLRKSRSQAPLIWYNRGMTDVVTDIQQAIVKALAALGMPELPVTVEQPKDEQHGDYAISVALQLAKVTGQSPMEVAEKITAELRKQLPSGVGKIDVVAPGFINLWLSRDHLAGVIEELLNAKKAYTGPRVGLGKRVVIEYSGPNIAKPMGVGHMRSTIIGQALVNIYQALGYDVVSTNHFGDWGTQFGKLLVAYKKWRDEAAYEANPIQYLNDLYVRFTTEAKDNKELEDEARAEFKKLEQGDEENLKLWKQFREASLKEAFVIYDRMGITIEHQMGESDYKDQAPEVYHLLEKSGLVKSEGDALILDPGDGLPTTLLRKSDASSLYITRDIAQVKYRMERWKPDLMIYVVGQDQSLHFKQYFSVVKKLGFVPNTVLVHVGFGLVMLDGKRMRTREGRIVFLEDVLNEAVEQAGKVVEAKSRAIDDKEKAAIAEKIGIGSVKYNDLSQSRTRNIEFNWEKMLALEGNSAPYLMYSLARANSVLDKAESKPAEITAADLADQAVLNLARYLEKYNDAVLTAAQDYHPHVIATYLFGLAQRFNEFYASEPILSAESAQKQARLAVTQAVATVLADGLGLLGIEFPQRM